MEKTKVINTILIIAIILLAINLINPISSTTGNIIYNLDTTEPKCSFNNLNELNEIPIDRCCSEIQKQLICEFVNEEGSNLKCYTSKTSGTYYLINNKAFNLCKIEGYDVQIK